MPSANQMVAIEIDDATIAKLTADTTGSPTYATTINVPNIVELTVEAVLKTATLEGDSAVTAVFSKVTHATGTIRFRSVPLDVLEVLIGATLTASGVTPNMQQLLAIAANSKPNYFKLQGRSTQTEGLDAVATGLRTVVYKAKLTGNPRINFNGDYVMIESNFTAVRTNSDGKLIDVIGEETQTVLA